MKTYEVKIVIRAIVETNNKKRAKEIAIERFENGEYIGEIESVKEDKEEAD